MIKIIKKRPKFFSLKLLIIILVIIVLFLVFMTAGRKIAFERAIVGKSVPLHISKKLERNEKGNWEFVVSLKNEGWKNLEISGFVKKDSNILDSVFFTLSGEDTKILKAPMLNVNPLISIEVKEVFKGKILKEEKLILSPHYSSYHSIFSRIFTVFDLDCCIPYYSKNMGLEWSDWLDFYRSLPSSISYIDESSLFQLFPSRLERKGSFLRKQTELKIFVGFPEALFKKLNKEALQLKISLYKEEVMGEREIKVEKIKYNNNTFYYGESCTLNIKKGNIDSLSLIFSSLPSRLFVYEYYYLSPLKIELPDYNNQSITESYERWILCAPRFPFVSRFFKSIKRKICYFIQ